MTTGDVPYIRVWSVEKGLSISDIQTGDTASVTSLVSSHSPITLHLIQISFLILLKTHHPFSPLVIAGFSDGVVQLYDSRCPPNYSFAFLFDHITPVE